MRVPIRHPFADNVDDVGNSVGLMSHGQLDGIFQLSSSSFKSRVLPVVFFNKASMALENCPPVSLWMSAKLSEVSECSVVAFAVSMCLASCDDHDWIHLRWLHLVGNN
eukprot:TRINITY_DN1810_c0_g1_i9.p2 TRINITY_DN1810_c0_g1~~TRINITY_DN1810_c0_g1_i9.p2  ORF type:complete len:108 (+),score=9.87 TRINITY_DN1810_c0_g1_i9:192-515(+)